MTTTDSRHLKSLQPNYRRTRSEWRKRRECAIAALVKVADGVAGSAALRSVRPTPVTLKHDLLRAAVREYDAVMRDKP